MDKDQFKKIALAGIAFGILATTNTTLDACGRHRDRTRHAISWEQESSIDLSHLYANNLKNWDLDLAKAPGFDLPKSGPYYNTDTIFESGRLCVLASAANATPTPSTTPKKETLTTAPVNTTEEDDPNSGNLGYHLLSEEELLIDLSAEGAALYKKLDPEAKALALKVASTRCNGTNECRGLNACQNDMNACAGQGSCKGKGKCAFSSKDLAVKVVAKKMAEKRTLLTKP